MTTHHIAAGVVYGNAPPTAYPPDPATEAANARAFAALLRVGIDPGADGALSDETAAPMHRAMDAADMASPRGDTAESRRAWTVAYAEACEAEAARFEAGLVTP